MTEEDILNQKAKEVQNPFEAKEPNESATVLPNLDGSKYAISDKLGDLEVERLEASDELERLRSQNASQVQDQTDLDGSDISESTFVEEDSGLMDILKESNLSARHVKFCCGGVFIVIFIAGFVFGGMKFLDWWKEKPKTTKEPYEVEEIVEELEEIPNFDEENIQDPSLYASWILGENTLTPDPAVDAGSLLGEELVDYDSLALSIQLFGEMYEIMQVDLRSYLNQSVDRQASLEEYINELKYLSYKGSLELEKLNSLTESLREQFAEKEAEKDVQENLFFEKLANLDAYGSSATLKNFTILGEEVVNLRANYLSRQKLISYYKNVLESMDQRMKDIDFNEEALIKGIQVVEITGSDLNLIIQEDEL